MLWLGFFWLAFLGFFGLPGFPFQGFKRQKKEEERLVSSCSSPWDVGGFTDVHSGSLVKAGLLKQTILIFLGFSLISLTFLDSLFWFFFGFRRFGNFWWSIFVP